MKKSYVYKITCLVTGEYYFGSSFYAKRDYYWGKGRKIKDRVALYGKDNFIKEILGEFDDRTIALQVENQYIEKFRHDDKCLNKRLDNHFGLLYGEEFRAKIGTANRLENLSDETRAKISAAKRGEKNPMCREENRAKLSAALRGEKNPNFGKHHTHTDETRAKISAALRGEKSPCYRKHWRKNPITGKREWYD